MRLRSPIIRFAVLLAVAGCKGPESRVSETAVASAPAMTTAADTAFHPADTAVAAAAADTQPAPVATKFIPRAVTSKTAAPAPAATASSPVASTPSPAPVRDTQLPVAPRETTVTVPTPPQLKEPEPLVRRDSAFSHAAYRTGEVLEYQVKFGSISVGKATLEVIGTDTIRGIPAVHIMLRVEGKLGFVGVKDRYESWFDPRTMSSLRYVQDIDEATYERERHYEIYPERKTYHEKGKKELPSVAAPLDDASFLFFLRTIPLAVGETYSFDRYFKPDRNPVKVVVLRKEKVKVPAGSYSTVVVRPIIKTTGLFSEGGKAEVWFSDDDARLLVQLKTQMKIGSLNLYLRKVRSPAAP